MFVGQLSNEKPTTMRRAMVGAAERRQGWPHRHPIYGWHEFIGLGADMDASMARHHRATAWEPARGATDDVCDLCGMVFADSHG